MHIRSVARVVLHVVIALAIICVGCKHSVAVVPAAAPASPPPPPQPSVTLRATPVNVQRGESATLRWSSTNAVSLTLSPGIGMVSAEGDSTVTPNDSTTYTITAAGPGGSATATTRVTVTAPPPPPAAVAVAASSLEELFNKEVMDAYFDFDKSDIRLDARTALTQTANFLKSYPPLKVIIEGHCDERGSTEYNLALSDRRAQAAKDFLVSLGVPPDNIQTVSYGKERPFCTEHTENCWQQNRRAHFIMAS